MRMEFFNLIKMIKSIEFLCTIYSNKITEILYFCYYLAN